MDYVRRYTAPMKYWKAIMNRINIVRLAKRLYLLFELVGVDRGKLINAYYNLSEESAIQWLFMFEREDTKITNGKYKT